MSFLIRWVPTYINSWQEELIDIADGNPPAQTPIWALSTFIPKEDENGTISLYRVDDLSPENIETVSAAMAMRAPQIDRYVFVGQREQELVDAGLIIASSIGNTKHRAVDPLHVDMRISSLSEAQAATDCFLRGAIRFAEKPRVQIALRESARNEAFDFAALAREKSSNAFRDKAFTYVKDAVLELRGISSPSS